MIKVLVTDGLSEAGVKILSDSGLFELNVRKATEKAELLQLLPTQEVVIIRSATKLTREFLDAAKSLKVIMRAGAGVDNVDVAAASEKGVLVFNTPGVNNNAVAELTLGFLFGLLREIPRATSGMKQGQWEKKELVGGEAAGRTIGILGYGAIGALVGKACHALGMKVNAFDPMAKKEAHNYVGWKNSVDEVFASSDVVSLHLPLMDSTTNSIGAEQFKKMKKGSYFINCSRGGIVREADLLVALNEGIVAGAALDVFEKEPVTANNPLVMHPKVICAPHIGAATKEAQHKVGMAAGHYLVQYYRSGDVTTAVNAKDCRK